MEVFDLGPDDLAEIVAVAEVMYHEADKYHDIDFDRKRVALWALRYLKNDFYFKGFGVRNAAGILVGGLFCKIDRMFFSNDLHAVGDVFYVMPPFRGTMAAPLLLKAAIDWAKENDAPRFVITAVAGINNNTPIAKTLGRAGFSQIGIEMEYVIGQAD